MADHSDDIKKLLEENLKVVKANHELLEKMHRIHVYTFWMKALWFAVIIGVPFLLYYAILQPYLQAFGLRGEEFGEMLKSASYLLKSLPGGVNAQ